MHLKLLSAATAANGAPSAATAGVPLAKDAVLQPLAEGFGPEENEWVILVWNSAGTGSLTVQIRLWAYSAKYTKWFPLGAGTDAGKGVINGGATIGPSTTDLVLHAEVVAGLRHFQRVYAEIVSGSIGGTGTPAFHVALICRGGTAAR